MDRVMTREILQKQKIEKKSLRNTVLVVSLEHLNLKEFYAAF